MLAAFFTGLAGQLLSEAEQAFLRSARPSGIILFARNIDTPTQVRRLIAEAKAAVGSNILVLIDQEGGRVQRLRPPHWRALPAGRHFSRLQAIAPGRPLEAARLVAHLTAGDLRDLGINCNCAPVLDLPVPGSHDVIGDRAYATSVSEVVAFGRAVIDGFIAGGVLPVVKHIPGHGRATSDSHYALPIVSATRADLDATDFATFKALADAPAAMTAHVVFTAIDGSAPASTSSILHRDVMRGHIGFDGLLMSDDLSMHALSGTMRERAGAVIAAGSDIALHCNGNFAEMEDVAASVPQLTAVPLTRFQRALATTHQQAQVDRVAAEACIAEIFALSA
jgi:beta-N-acetylhexosaminidase